MNATEYKEICDKPDVLSKHVLEETLNVLKKGDVKEQKIIQGILAGNAIPFPEKYSGEVNQCYFKVVCSDREAEAITDILFDAEASSVPANGIATGKTMQYVELVNIWSELTEYVGSNV